MNEKEVFISLAIIGFVLGIVGFSTMVSNPLTGAVIASFDDIENTHNKCIQGQCVEVFGSGNNECFNEDHCYHLACINQQCTLVGEPGPDRCQTNEECFY